jgi:hypothetical protein
MAQKCDGRCHTLHLILGELFVCVGVCVCIADKLASERADTAVLHLAEVCRNAKSEERVGR